MEKDPFVLNIQGVGDLVQSGVNKANSNGEMEEGVEGEYIDKLELPMSDEELLKLRDGWVMQDDAYTPKIRPRQNKNKMYLLGRQRSQQGYTDTVISSNLLFEATSTYIPEALAKNPDPVVFSDDTPEGKAESNDIKTMLQFHADILGLRQKLGVMLTHWSVYFLGIVKHGWDSETNDIKTDIRKPQNFLLDPNGYIDEFGSFCGEFLGERIESTAEKLIEMFPKHMEYITVKVNGKLGTSVVRTEWWTDKYCFTTFQDEVLDKHKNELFNYGSDEEKDEEGNVTQTATPGLNHFSVPKMPYTFLSVFSLQEQPYDDTNLIEQNIPNQDRISDRDEQISKNLASANNSVVLDDRYFTSETAAQARDSFFEEGFILGNVDGVKRIPASPLPNGLMESQAEDKMTLRSIYGTQGLTATPQNENTTARGMILNQSHDSSRIGGGTGDKLEQVAKNIFNWWLQLYYVFYDEPHYGAIMGNGAAVSYVQLVMSNQTRKFVVSVAPNSMKPKDEISQQNIAMERWTSKAIDPISFMKEMNSSDPIDDAKKLAIWTTNPQLYMQMYFPEAAQAPDSANPQVGAAAPPEPGAAPTTLAAPAASSTLSQVPINTNALPK